MADEKYKSGMFKGFSKEDVRAARDFLKDSKASVTDLKIMQILKGEGVGLDLNKGGMVKSRTGPQDFRKGGMVLSTMDNRKNK